MEINKLKSKEENIQLKNPIGEEKKEITKNFQKSQSNIFSIINDGKDSNNQLI